MTFMWTACSFNYYMIGIYVKYIPGNIFINSIASGMSENIAYPLGGWIYAKAGIRWSFTSLLALSAVGGFCIIFLGEDSKILMPIFVIIAKFGISGGYTILYVSTNDVFPILFCSTAMGICNFIARFMAIFSAEIAEVKPPLPMILYSSLSLGGAILIQFVKTLVDQEKDKLKEEGGDLNEIQAQKQEITAGEPATKPQDGVATD